MEVKKYRGHLAALFCAVVWGTTFISSKLLMRHIKPVELLVYRFLIGYLMLWLVCPKKLSLRDRKHELYFAAAGGFGVVVYFLCENLALTYTLASNVSIIVSVAPLFTAIFASLFLKEEKIKKSFMIGFICAITGIIMVSLNGSAVLKLNPLGDFLSLISAIVWAVYSVLVKKISKFQYPVLLVTRRIFFYGLLFMVPIMPLFGFQWKTEFLRDPVNLFNLVFLGVCACALCYCIWNYAVDTLGAVATSNYIYAVPAITTATSVAVLQEPVTAIAIFGMMLTMVGLVISSRK